MTRFATSFATRRRLVLRLSSSERARDYPLSHHRRSNAPITYFECIPSFLLIEQTGPGWAESSMTLDELESYSVACSRDLYLGFRKRSMPQADTALELKRGMCMIPEVEPGALEHVTVPGSAFQERKCFNTMMQLLWSADAIFPTFDLDNGVPVSGSSCESLLYSVMLCLNTDDRDKACPR